MRLQQSLLLRSYSYFPNLLTIVGDLAGGAIRCLVDEVDGADGFQDYVCVSWKKDIFVRFLEL